MSDKQKILFIRTTLGQGGADRVAVNLVNFLAREGFTVKLLLMKKEGEYLADIPHEVLICKKNVRNLWLFLPHLFRTIKAEKPDVVFSLDGGVNVLLGILAMIAHGPWKVVVSERNVLFPPGKSRLKFFLLTVLKFITYRFADGITAVSEGVRQELIRTLKLPAQKIEVVYNPLVTDELVAKASEPVNHPWFQYPRAIPVIVHAGRFVYQKDHSTLIRAFAKVNKHLQCRLFLLGDGPLKTAMQNLAASLGVSDNIYFAGFDKNPYKYFAQCDAFVLSSRHEGMPGVLIQALACGAPVISTNCTFGPEEILGSTGEYGILVPVEDANAMAQAITLVLSNAELKNKLKATARQAVLKFTPGIAVNSYIHSFRRLL